MSDKGSMKNKELINSKQINIDEKALPQNKPKSLRPMRSMVAVRSLKPRTTVAQVTVSKQISENTLN